VSGPTRDQVYDDQVAKVFLDCLTSKTPKYRNPWLDGVGPTPFGQYNPVTSKQYNGSNQALLTAVAIMRGYDDDRWLGIQQGGALGGRVRKGEKGTLIRYYREIDVEGKDKDGEPEMQKRMKPYYSYVWNASQFDGLPMRPPIDMSKTADMMHAEAQAVVDRLGVPVLHDTNKRAYYDSRKDEIHLPPKEQFRTKGDYWATLLHECAHATGHASRQNRNMQSKKDDLSVYAREELNAEIASMMLGQRVGVHAELGQHQAYVKHWVQILTDKPGEILKACATAEKICFDLGVHAPAHERLPFPEKTPEQKAKVEQGVAKIKEIEAESQKRARVRQNRVRTPRPKPSPELTQSQSR
jgi:antirestriction protein ArdC